MKKKIIAIMLVTALLVGAGFAFAEEEEKAQPQRRDARTGRTVRTEPKAGQAERPRMMPPRQEGMDRESMFKEQLEKRQADHEASVGELKAILRTAEEEKATKTAEMLRKLIDRKDAEYKKAQEQMDQRRKRMEDMMKQREEEMKKRQDGAQKQGGEESRGDRRTSRPRIQKKELQETAEDK